MTLRPRRLTETGLLELTLALAQYHYYELAAPVMSDADYDALERRYAKLLKQNKGVHGVVSGMLDRVGSGENLGLWLTAWRD
jgi:NAD-dependent DNA ligase